MLKIKLPIIKIILIILVSFPLMVVAEEKEEIAAKNLKSYSFNPDTTLRSRIKPAPPFVMDYLIEMDGRPDYSSYAISDDERSLIEDYLSKLPPVHQNVLKERLIGIYFVNNFIGSGFAEYVLSDKNDIYSFLVFNPLILKNDLSEWLSYRENTCFINKSPEYRIEIDCGREFLGLMYGLLHETSHVVDYVLQYTPFVEPALTKIDGYQVKSSDFTRGIWSEYYLPSREYRSPYRKKISFYGLGGGVKIDITDSVSVYKKLKDTPFVSIYGWVSWAEDFAELITFYHLTEKLHQPYEIRVYEKGNLIFKYDPMDSPKVKQRLQSIQSIYSEKDK